ncbi:MAG: PH domain-containing protein [Cephaloticoccus sp.]|nr:PH domain-containing protein [Cephaloticoccus sp.]MCF7760590.1 PH domain-containing protein [Cephaloticoccus sp.]
MFDWLRGTILRVARVPAQPVPPSGAPGSARIFRAGRNFYKLRLVRWGFTQIGAVVGILFSLWFIDQLIGEIGDHRATPAPIQITTPSDVSGAQPPETPALNSAENRPPQHKGKRNGREDLARKLAAWPDWTTTMILWVEYGAIVLFILQLPVTLVAARLEYEQHWYIVTDRSLRIRTGLFSLQEATMSFANLQQVEVKQGPLQRLLGIADVRVQSAGGGSTGGNGHHKGGADHSMHSGVFHGVDNPDEIRDLILTRLRLFRAAGLGDPDDGDQREVETPPNDAPLAAARELLEEIRLLAKNLKP